jgi:hypothetical protein
MASYTLAPWFVQQLFDDDGEPLAFGKVFSYASGTSTPVFTFADAIGTLNTNPLILSSSGRMRMYLDTLVAYKMIVTDANDVPVGLTMDPVNAVGSATGAGSGPGEVFAFEGNSSAAITATVYASGATFDTLHPGTAVMEVDSADLVGTFVIEFTGVMVGAGTLTCAIMDLSSGSPDTPLATATITSTTGEVGTSGAIVFGAPGIDRQYGVKCIVSANTGFAWGIALRKIA